MELQEILEKRRLMYNYPLPTEEGYQLINMHDILYLEADGQYTVFYFEGGKKILSSKNIGFFENELERQPFLRVHNSFVVNLNKVWKYIKAEDGYIVLIDKSVIKVSRSKKDYLLSIFRLPIFKNETTRS